MRPFLFSCMVDSAFCRSFLTEYKFPMNGLFLSENQAIIDAASYVPPPPSEEQKKKIAKM